MTGPQQARQLADGASANRIGPERARAGEAPARSTVKGDVPQPILDRYLIERDLRGRAERFYRDHRTPDPAFSDTGRRLSAAQAYPDTIADMLKVARHRGWTRLKVEGDEAFRREVWIQARAQGLEVNGYRPRDRDHQAAGLPLAPQHQGERLRKAAAVVRSLIPDVEAQRRLIAYAVTRAGLSSDRDHALEKRDRGHARK
jgi:hypothetical protein